jgi:hypothetical protein
MTSLLYRKRFCRPQHAEQGNCSHPAAVHAWPMQHPELAVACWAVAMLVVFAPLAVHLYRRKAPS